MHKKDKFTDNIYKASQIKSLSEQEKIRENIYIRPGMFFGKTDERGVEQFIYELVANGIDRFVVGKATFIKVQLEGNTITVSDDGDGLPFDEQTGRKRSLATQFLTEVHFTPSGDAHNPHIHLVGLGLGAACLNIASSFFEVESWRNGSLWRQTFVKGRPRQEATIIKKGTGKGTTIRLTPHFDIFGNCQPRTAVVRKVLFEVAHLFAGLKVHFQEECFFAPEGLKMLGSILIDRAVAYEVDREPFYAKLKYEDIEIEAAAFDDNSTQEKILSWVNGVRTVDLGSHVAGFQAALHSINWNPQIIFIHVIMHNPCYAAPIKTKLDVPEVEKKIKQALKEPLQEYYSLSQ